MNDAAQISVGELLRRLEAEGYVDELGIGRVAAHLHDLDAERSSPWYLKVMTGIGAWLAGIFFLGFLACAGVVSETPLSLGTWGVILLVGAVTIWRMLGRIDFASQFALALSVAAHALLIYVAGEVAPGTGGELGAAALMAVVLCALLYPLYREPVHRFLSSLLAVGLAVAWLVTEGADHLIHAAVAIQIAGVCAIFASERVRRRPIARALAPLGYALAISLLVTSLVAVVAATEIRTPLWPSSAILAAALVYVIVWAGGGGGWLRKEPAWWAIGVAVLLGAVSTPGLLAALALLAIGFASEDYLLEGLGLAFLPVFVVVFYYMLEVDLLTKSAILLASGVVLLAARTLAGWRPWARMEEAA
jgi:hypothetical protein